MPCNFICLFCTKVIVGFCILHKSLALTLPCHFPPAPHLPVALMVLPVENGAFSAACTQLVGRQDLQIVSTNTEQDFFSPSFFQPAHSHSYHSRAIKVFKERSVLSKPRHFFSPPSICSCLFSIEVVLWSYESLEIVFAWFIFMAQQSGESKCQGHLSCSPSAPWLCAARRKRLGAILHFMTYCVKRAPRQTGGSLDVRSSCTRLTKTQV